MPQIFHRSTNTISRVSIFGAVFAIGGGLWAAYLINDSPYITRERVPIPQPIPFSHQHHVTDDGIDCRYCHTTVEVSAFAGMPTTHVCMSCHSQIWTESPALEPVRESYRSGTPLQWNRVHDLPDFVYFNHSIHVAKGIGCETCHGRVDRMPLIWREATLQMSWCLDCHRAPEKYVRPRERVFEMGWQPQEDQLTLGRKLVNEYKIQKLTDCYTCHR
jgi:hypothetical protein